MTGAGYECLFCFGVCLCTINSEFILVFTNHPNNSRGSLAFSGPVTFQTTFPKSTSMI